MVAAALSLESRIAAMLSAADAKSDAVAALIVEVEAAAQDADATATKTREETLDPTVIVDTVKAGAALATAELSRDRLRAALPRLQARHKELVEADYAAVKARRNATARQLSERYPALVAELVALMADIAATDREVDCVNAAAPYGDHPRLRGVEVTARGLDRLLHPDVSIMQELRLPTFTRAANEPVLAYPLPVTNLALQVLAAMPPDNFDWRNWHQEFEKRDRRILEDNRTQIAEAEQRQREREVAEAHKAKEADEVAVGR
jgi:hypothetical protein